MLAPAVLLAFLVAAPAAPPPAPHAVRAVPDEPGTVVLPDAPILQTVAADVDADGRTDLVRLVRGEGDAALIEVWVERVGTWALLGEPLVAVPASRGGPRTDPVHLATPVRLLVRRVDGTERVTVASQPHFEEIDTGEPCCLLLNDLVVADDGVAILASVAEPADAAISLLVIDLDGDGTDELLSTFALPPSDGVSPPTLARVHRWTVDRFARPVASEMAAGSGEPPFVLGDSDGLPGDEAAVTSTLGTPGLFRMRLVADDALAVDVAGLVAEQAMAVPLGDGRGVAVRGGPEGLITASWPPGQRLGEPLGSAFLPALTMVGTLELGGTPHLGVHRPTSATLDLLRLPGLERAQVGSIPRSPAAARLSDGPPAPFVGVLEADPSAAVIVNAGRLVSEDSLLDGIPLPIATLAGATPVGRVGDGTQLALHHGPIGPPPPAPGGGAFLVPTVQPLAWTSIVPFDLVGVPELDAGSLEPEPRGAVTLGEGELAAGAGGFSVLVAAPAGSRVLVADGPTVSRVALVVPEGGRLDVPLASDEASRDPVSRQVRLVVLTPAGRAYEAAWDVVSRVALPAVEVAATTTLGSVAVDIRGSTVAGASVRVDGRPVAVDPDGRFATRVDLPPWPTEVVVEVDDGLGNVARTAVDGVGVFDYRALPWVPIVAALLAGVGVVLVLRVPRAAAARRASDDDAQLEELEPD